MDEHILHLISVLAEGFLAEDNAQGPYCLYCSAGIQPHLREDQEVRYPHMSTCPIVLARKILATELRPIQLVYEQCGNEEAVQPHD